MAGRGAGVGAGLQVEVLLLAEAAAATSAATLVRLFLDSNIKRHDRLTGSPGKSQKEGQEDEGRAKESGGSPPL